MGRRSLGSPVSLVLLTRFSGSLGSDRQLISPSLCSDPRKEISLLQALDEAKVINSVPVFVHLPLPSHTGDESPWPFSSSLIPRKAYIILRALSSPVTSSKRASLGSDLIWGLSLR